MGETAVRTISSVMVSRFWARAKSEASDKVFKPTRASPPAKSSNAYEHLRREVIALQASAAFQGMIQNRRKGVVAEPMKLNDTRSG